MYMEASNNARQFPSFFSWQLSQSSKVSLTSTMTQHGFYPSPSWTQSSDGAIVSGSNLNHPLVEFDEELCLRAMFQGLERYHLKPVKE